MPLDEVEPPLPADVRIEERSRDLRLGGTWTPLQRVKNDALWTVARLALAAAYPMSLSLLRVGGRTIGVLAHTFARSARRVARANVARVFPGMPEPEREALVRRCFVTLGEVLGETVAMTRPGRCPTMPVSGDALDVLDAAIAEGRGVVFASAHLGPWERVAASLVAARVPLVALARESYDPRFSRMVEKLRSHHGVSMVWRSTPGAVARILRALRTGKVLGVPMDLRGRVPSCDVPFLGHDAPTAVGPARIALRSRAAVVVGTAARAYSSGDGGDGLVVTATRIQTSDLPISAPGARQLTARINEELSRRILALPYAWVWMHDRWTHPSGV